jgi:ribosome-interacting GTPase 1
MPTNLPPQYFEVEREYRAAQSTAEKIKLLEELLSIVPKHKGTEKLQGDLKKRLSKLRSRSDARRPTTKRASAFVIDREGAGTVVIIGPPNVGKSSLVAALTNATPEVAPFPYTTWTPTPGMMEVENVQIQLIDTPPLNPEYVEPELYNLIRRCDLMLLLVDLVTDPIQQIEDCLALLEEHRILPRRRKQDYSEDRRVVFKPLLVAANRADDEASEEDYQIFRALLDVDWQSVPISALTGRNLEALKRRIFERLDVLRIYSKVPGKEPDRTSPFVCKKGSTVEDFAAKVHKDFVENLKGARVWGRAVYDGQMVGRDYVLQDEDVVELHT